VVEVSIKAWVGFPQEIPEEIKELPLFLQEHRKSQEKEGFEIRKNSCRNTGTHENNSSPFLCLIHDSKIFETHKHE